MYLNQAIDDKRLAKKKEIAGRLLGLRDNIKSWCGLGSVEY